MTDSNNSHPEPQPDSPNPEEKQFHGWRLIGVILLVVIGLAVISAVVDWLVIGPLEGRMF